MEPEKSGQDRRGEIPFDVQIDEEEKIKDEMKPERTTLQSSPAGTSVETPKQSRPLCREMQQITVGGCRHADGSMKQGEAFLFNSLSG